MVGQDIGSYTFSPSTGQVTIVGVPNLLLEQILLITNVASNLIIYNFADPLAGGTYVASTGVLTLNYTVSAQSSTDRLQIWIEQAFQESDLLLLIRRMVKLLEPLGTVDINNRQRVSIDASTITQGVSGTVTVNGSLTSGGTVTVGTNNIAAYLGNAPANPLTLIGTAYLPVGIVEGPVDQRWRIIDAARQAYAAGLRQNLVFS